MCIPTWGYWAYLVIHRTTAPVPEYTVHDGRLKNYTMPDTHESQKTSFCGNHNFTFRCQVSRILPLANQTLFYIP